MPLHTQHEREYTFRHDDTSLSKSEAIRRGHKKSKKSEKTRKKLYVFWGGMDQYRLIPLSALVSLFLFPLLSSSYVSSH
jgi:hypothetical protein